MSGVVILCGGQQTRLASLGYPKQLVAVAGEPILLRTVRLIREVLDVPICVASNGALNEVCRDHGLSEYVVGNRPMLLNVERAMRARHWQRALVFLGDVCWSRRLLRHWLTACAERCALYCARVGASAVTGKAYGEHFALQCTLQDLDRLDARRFFCLRDAARTKVFGTRRAIEQPADDFTEDFDTLDDVQRLVPLLTDLVHQEAA